MGILNEVAGDAAHQSNFGRSNAGVNPLNFKSRLIESAARVFDSEYSNNKRISDISGLSSMLESSDPKEVWRGSTTILAMRKMEEFIENMKVMHGESVVTASLGSLVPRILDVVRIFYPNIVAQDLVDIQPLSGQVGEIFIMKPRYDQTVPGITPDSSPGTGSQVFQQYPTFNNYASETNTETVGTGNGSIQTFAYTTSMNPIRQGTVSLSSGTVSVTDDGNGNLVGNGIAGGSVNYTTGAISVSFTIPPTTGTTISVSYLYSSENSDTSIRSLSFDLSTTPVKAKLHPLRYQYSVAAGLAAQAHLAIDVQDTLAQLVAQYVKVERDNQLISLINNAAAPQTILNFDVGMSGVTYDRRTKYGEFELKVDEAEAIIQSNIGRGGIDFVLAGRDAANVIRQGRGFRPEPVRAPIGAHRIGTLRDGTVSVVKVVNTNIMPASSYVFGFKGYMTGDSATILAEWIPMYFSPVFQSPTLVNSQGVFSAYDMFLNNANYYVSGTLSNYGA